jgi:hypothetical protein
MRPSKLDLRWRFPYSQDMEVNFTPELEAKLDRIAEANRGVAGDYVRQLVETYVDHDVWFRERVTASL